MDRFLPFRTAPAERLGAAVQQLRNAGVLRVLSPFEPVLAGTLPLGVDVPGSDADILCVLRPEHLFLSAVHSFSRFPHFSLRRSVRCGRPTAVCRFRAGDLSIEVFAQAGPLASQRGYRHLEVEHRLLSMGGEGLRERVMELRRSGMKTEPAFAHLLGLPGDPYEAMHEISRSPDAALQRLLRTPN
ncbi:MAG: DUF4269 domain-containing protein [Thermaerobacter sp.]|nr:DUF4269 domain-containing protein [Thermaerobacter sp.]